MSYNSQWTPEKLTRAEVDALPGLTLLEFGADWCPHCQAPQAGLKEALQDRSEVRHIKVEDGSGRPLGRSFKVKLWPNFVFLRDGELVEQLARPPLPELLAALSKLT